jgi:PAS domain S-box-containing protein
MSCANTPDHSDQWFRELANSLPQTIFETDLDGRITFVNQSGFEVWQGSPEDVVRGTNVLDWVVPEDQAMARANLGRMLRGEIQAGECRARRKDGTSFPAIVHARPVLRDGVPVGLRGIVVDLTAQRRAEEARVATDRRFRSLVKNAIFGIYRSTLEGRFVEVNPALVRILGYTSEAELLAVPVFSLYADPRDRRILVERFIKSERVANVEVEWRRKDGSPMIVRLNGRWVSGDGLPEGFEMIVEDVTRQRALEDELYTVQKLDGIGRQAARVAHDFSALLGVILRHADLLLSQLADDDAHRAQIAAIHETAERAAVLTRQLLPRKPVSRTQPLDPLFVDGRQ